MPETAQLGPQNPWPGLRAFTEKDREFFFGREREIAELLELVQQSPAVVLYGQSGLGKTSLLQAGLFPELKRLDFLPFRIRFNHGEDAPPLAEQIKSALSDELDRAGIECPRPTSEETLWEYFHRRDLDLWGAGNRLLTPVIVVDQFEEIFTLGQRSERAAARAAQLAADLESVLEHRPPQAVRERLDQNPDQALHYDLHRQSGKFVISLREDFLGYLDSWCRRIPSLLSVANRFRLQAMTGAQAREVVERGGRNLVDDAVARDIVEFVSDARQRVAPALLSVVLEGLNHRRVEHGQARITAEFLEGERGKIIQDFYERSFEGIDPRLRTWVEDRLLTGGGHRQPAALEDALRIGIPESDCNLLVNRRVLHRAERDNVVWLELTHDLLSDPASRSRAEREQRQQAEEAARLQRHQVEEAARKQEEYKRELQKSRRLAVVFGALLVVAVAACLLVVRYNRLAKQNEAARSVMYRSAAEIADSLSIDVLTNSWVPVATVEETIRNAEESYQKLYNPAANPGDLATYVGIPQARFLASAADALYQGGHFAEGLQRSAEAMGVLKRLGAAGTTGSQAKIARAEILYEQGRGSLELDKLDDANRDFTEALTLVASVPKWKTRPDTSRVFVMAQIGLGRIYDDPCTLSEAVKHFQTAFDQAQNEASALAGSAKGADPDRDEANYLEIRALLELGGSQWDPVQAQKRYAEADAVLGRAEKDDMENPRWRTLSGELAYDAAYSASELDQYDAAKSKVDGAIADFQELTSRDPLNWHWQLMLGKSRHLLATLYAGRKEWDLAQSLLNQSQDSANQLLKDDNQAAWVQANLLRVSDLESLSSIPVLEFVESFDRPKAAQDEMMSAAKAPENMRILDSSLQPLNDADAVLRAVQGSATNGSGCFVERTEIANFRGLIHYLESLFVYSVKNDQAGVQRLDKQALGDYSQGIEMLQAIERRAAQSNPTPRFLKAKGQAYDGIAEVQDDLKDESGRLVSIKNSIAADRALVRAAPTAKNYDALSREMESLGDYYNQNKNYAQALSQYELAMTTLGVAVAKAAPRAGQTGSGGLQFANSKATLYGKLADIELTRGDVPGAFKEIGGELDTVWNALPTDYTNQSYLGDLASCKTQLETIRDGLESSDAKLPYSNLSAGQKKTLLAQDLSLWDRTDPLTLLKGSGGVWPLPPLFPGAWRTLDRQEYGPDGILRELSATRRDVTQARILGVRSLALGFYDGGRVYEVAAEGLRGTLFYLRRGNDWAQLKGAADTIQEMNRRSPPHLDTVERATAYLHFFVGTVQDPQVGGAVCGKRPQYSWEEQSPQPAAGLCSLVDQATGIPWLVSATAQQRAAVTAEVQPLRVEESPDHEWQARGTVECGGDLFDVTFRLSRTGTLDTSQSCKKDQNLPVAVRFISADGIRTQGTMEDLYLDALQRNPDNAPALKGLIDIYASGKQYDKEEHLLLDVMKRSPNNPTALGGLSNLYEETKQPEKEERLLVETTQRDPGNEMALERLVEFYDAGQNDKKEALLLGVLKQEPENEIALDDLMQMYQLSGQYGKEKALLLRQLKRDPTNERALRTLPQVYYDAKDWKDAVLAQENWISRLRSGKADAHIFGKGELNSDLVSAYTGLAWYQFFARDFSGALASADAGLKLDPADLGLAAKQAEAMLFLNRTQEADAIFLGNRGKQYAWQTWDEMVLRDFDTLEKGGLTNPEMTRLRSLLSAKPASSPAAPGPGSPAQNSRPN